MAYPFDDDDDSAEWTDVESSEFAAGQVAHIVRSVRRGENYDRDLNEALERYWTFFFPQFQQLPPEIQRHIWKLFCPDLAAKARVLQFQEMTPQEDGSGPWRPTGCWRLRDQTKALREMSAVNRDSREMVMRRYPDTLKIYGEEGDGELRINNRTDIFYFIVVYEPEVFQHLGGNFEQVAAESWENFRDFANCFPQLKTIYYAVGSDEMRTRVIEWCGSPQVCSAKIETIKEPGYEDDAFNSIYCWPGPSSSSCDHVLRAKERFADTVEPALRDDMEQRGIRIAEMVSFDDGPEIKLVVAMAERFRANKQRRDHYLPDEDTEDESGASAAGDFETHERADRNVSLRPQLRDLALDDSEGEVEFPDNLDGLDDLEGLSERHREMLESFREEITRDEYYRYWISGRPTQF